MSRPTIREQLRRAFDTSGLTMTQLRTLSKLDVDESGLGRKLNGKQSLRSEEIDALAFALGVQVSVGRDRKAS